jgi:hypothetical protein
VNELKPAMQGGWFSLLDKFYLLEKQGQVIRRSYKLPDHEIIGQPRPAYKDRHREQGLAGYLRKQGRGVKNRGNANSLPRSKGDPLIYF